MPQALEIVPGVLEEFDDRMDLDSGNGLDPNDTLAAAVQCLLQCLNPATAGSGEGEWQGRFPFLHFSIMREAPPPSVDPANP